MSVEVRRVSVSLPSGRILQFQPRAPRTVKQQGCYLDAIRIGNGQPAVFGSARDVVVNEFESRTHAADANEDSVL
jgi:hypothetical protein